MGLFGYSFSASTAAAAIIFFPVFELWRPVYVFSKSEQHRKHWHHNHTFCPCVAFMADMIEIGENAHIALGKSISIMGAIH